MVNYNTFKIKNNTYQPKTQRLLIRILCFAIICAFIVIVLGAYTRLTNAGLGCPDWPGCYGQLIIRNQHAILNTDPNSNITKAWTEMIHRYIAGCLGMLIAFTVAIIFCNNIKSKKYNIKFYILPILLISTVVFQVLLGMWTVTMKLLPTVVMGHLLGGFCTISLLLLILLSNLNMQNKIKFTLAVKFFAGLTLLALILQIILGGWTSSNYAAIPCIDFPTCNGHLLPENNTLQAMNPFYLTSNDFLITNYEGGILNNSMRVTIQLFHRWGALFFSVLSLVTIVSLKAYKNTYYKSFSNWLFFLLILQISLGIINVKLALPLYNAVLHNVIACLLLLSYITLNYKINRKPSFD